MNSWQPTRKTSPLSNGLLLVDKPVGPTSHDVVAAVRQAFSLKRVGHTGTLDPFASGLILIFLGQGTRLTRFMAPLHKTYTGVIRLGVETDTLDSTGVVVAEHKVDGPVQLELVEEVFETFLGEQQQVPPSFSAKKVNGVRAYSRARLGEDLELEPASVVIHRLEVTSIVGPDVSFVAEVGTGTYLRAIARDVGAKLELGGHLTALRRTKIGSFSVDDASGIDDLSQATPLELAAAVSHLQSVSIDEEQKIAVMHGKQVTPLFEEGNFEADSQVALTCGGSLVAIAEPSGDFLQPRVVVAG